MVKHCVAVIQMVSTVDVDVNIKACYQLISKAVERGARWIVLPEYWPIMGQKETDKLALAEIYGKGKIQSFLSETAKELQITLFGGSVPLQTLQRDRVFNSLLVYNHEGQCVSRYDKVHLFDFSGVNERYKESDTIKAGVAVPQLTVDGFNIGQGICYDLRFPEFFRNQLLFDVLILPAAFTYITGLAHWDILLKARAIENQCYVLASAQGGIHENGRKTFGHSMIIDPWGEVLSMVTAGEGIALAEISLNHLKNIRSKLPALSGVID